MKKFFKTIAMLSALALISGAVVSCSDDDEEGSTTTSTSEPSNSPETPEVPETATVIENSTLNGKIFSVDDEKDGTWYLKIENGEIYTGESADDTQNNIEYEEESEPDCSILSCNEKYYFSYDEDKMQRKSGSGLYTVFWFADADEYSKQDFSYTFSEDGSFKITYDDDSSVSGTFTNENGLIKATCTTESKEETYNMLYDGSSIYDEPYELTEITK